MSNPSGKTRTIDLPEDHYTLFNATRDGLPEIIVVNDALLAFPHTDIFPWHLRVRLDAKELAENGMPTPEERMHDEPPAPARSDEAQS